jgi:HD-GYP domain-containing protein (c-di-GMP phosphodiesterase class II)
MTPSSPKRDADQDPTANDPVLAALRQAENRYREIYLSLEQRNAEVQRALDQAREQQDALSARLAAQDRELDDARRRAQHGRETSETLAAALKEIHRALFSGNVFELILKACLTLTGATRGLYVTTSGETEPVRIRAAVDVGDYPSKPPSKFITRLSRAALEQGRVTACHELESTPEQTGPRETFRNCIAAPVVLRGDLSGVVIVADKATGDFTEADAGLLLSVGSHAAVALENTRLQHEVHEVYLSLVSVLARTMAARTQDEGRSAEANCRLASVVAERLGLSEYERSLVYYAALLHDIGKVGVSDGILNKPGQLLPVELELIRMHPQIGHDLLSDVPLLEPVAKLVRHHHERFDGNGYPDGLKGDAIPIAARIVAVVDAYGAMLAPRSYRPALTHEQACDQLRQGSATQFDPTVVDVFLSVVENTDGAASWRLPEQPELVLPGLGLQHGSPSAASAS